MSGPDAEDPLPLIGALLRMPVDAVHRRIIADLQAAGFADLGDAHMAVLRYPGPQGRRPSDLAAELGMSKQAVNYLLGGLERAGYVRRAADPHDGRSRRLELTERGEAVRTTIRSTVTAIEDELAAELGRAEFTQLRALLVRLNETEFVRGRAATDYVVSATTRR
jgi:DNA-binding MarR family transcriptional regulator